MTTSDLGVGKELVLTRTFHAPVGLVWKMWTDPAHIARWWSPAGFTNPVCEVDTRPGGAINIHMQGPDGNLYRMKGEFQEVDEPTRLVFKSSACTDENGEDQLEVVSTLTLEEVAGKTKITLHNLVTKAGPGTEFALAGMEEGWTGSLDKLVNILVGADSAGNTSDREVVLSHTFNAPRELVWKAYTDPAHVDKWWGPTGFTNTTHVIDVRPGGEWRFTMHGPDGTDFPNKIIYSKIEPPSLLEYAHSDDGGTLHFHVVITFEDMGGKTNLTMRSVFPTAEARDYVVREFHAIEGGKQHIQKLEAYIAAL